MATDSAFWRDLETQFRALPDPKVGLTATFGSGRWWVGGGLGDALHRARLQELFGSLARRAVITAGVPNRANALDGWLNLLRDESPHFHVVSDGEGWIENLALASADYCIVRETRALELETAAADGAIPIGLRRDRYRRFALGAMPTGSAFWRDLANRFHQALDGLDADRGATASRGDISALHLDNAGHWQIFVADCQDDLQAARLQRMFRPFAERAGIEVGAPDLAGSLDWWLNLLIEGEKPIVIKDLVSKFAKYCADMENTETVLERASVLSTPNQPSTAGASAATEAGFPEGNQASAAILGGNGPPSGEAALAARLEPARQSESRGKRGRPQTITDDKKAAARKARGDGGSLRDAAVILYSTRYPTPQQVKNASSILRHYAGKIALSLSETL